MVLLSGLTTPIAPLLATGNTAGASCVEGLVFSTAAIWDDVAFVEEEALVLYTMPGDAGKLEDTAAYCDPFH